MGLEVCVARLADSLEPPPRQTVSEWAGQNRCLSSEASAERGEWRPANPAAKAAGFWINQLYSPWQEGGRGREAERLETLAANVQSPVTNRVARSRWMQE